MPTSKQIIARITRDPRRRAALYSLVLRFRVIRAWIWRRMLWRTTVIVVAGSCGKTTTKEMLSNCLRDAGSMTTTPGSWNGLRWGGIVATILSARMTDRFLVVEAGIEVPGEMRRVARLLRPNVVVMTRVAGAHLTEFGSLENIANEKADLIVESPSCRLVVLNRDDPRVYAMKDKTTTRTVTFGLHADADVRCTRRDGTWPSRLNLTVETASQSLNVQTQLLGLHWTTAVLGALATAQELGVPLTECGPGIEEIEPVWGRMQPIELPTGITFIRDDYHGSPHNFEVAFEAIKNAKAARKILVSGAYGDAPGHSRARMRLLANDAAGIFDGYVFVGENAKAAAKVIRQSQTPGPELLMASNSMPEVIQKLKEQLRPGDLVLLKGTTSAHISRAYLGLLGDVQCDLSTCSKQILCDRCDQLGFQWSTELADYMAPFESYL